MLWVEPGSFLMGSPETEFGRKRQERQHRVTLTRGFWLAETSLTREVWQAVMVGPRDDYPHTDLPITTVSWQDCQEFLGRLNRLDHDGMFRLPYEAEWEYACRAGTQTAFAFGPEVAPNQVHCRFGTEAHGQEALDPEGRMRPLGPVPVKSKPPNAWGFREMHGNIWEMCADGYSSYPGTPRCDPFLEKDERVKMVRGGAWFNAPEQCRSAYRLTVAAHHREDSVGFRLAAWAL